MTDQPLTAKQQAAVELANLVEVGKRLAARRLYTENELAQAEQERAAWLLSSRKLLHQLFGDAAGLARHASIYDDAERPLHPTFTDRAADFQHAMMDQLVHLEKLLRLLKGLG